MKLSDVAAGAGYGLAAAFVIAAAAPIIPVAAPVLLAGAGAGALYKAARGGAADQKEQKTNRFTKKPK